MKLSSIKIALIAILNFFYAPYVWAQELLEGDSLGSYSWEAIKVVMSLAVVLVIFYLLVNVFKKYTGVSLKGSSSLRVLGGLSLGGKDKVVILEAGNVNFLVGVSNAGVSKLHQFKDDELNVNDIKNKAPNFNQHIEKILGDKS